jgi:flagellar P-ring protein precursor FlgI
MMSQASFLAVRARVAGVALLSLVFTVCAGTGQAERIKDIAGIAGVRSNQLVGYGLVVGLDGTGDQTSQTPFTLQSLIAMLSRFGVTVPPDVSPVLRTPADPLR